MPGSILSFLTVMQLVNTFFSNRLLRYKIIPVLVIFLSMNGLRNKKQRFLDVRLEFIFLLNLGSLVNSAASAVGYWQTKFRLKCQYKHRSFKGRTDSPFYFYQ